MTDPREERFQQIADEVSAPLHAYVARRVRPDDVDDVLADVSVVLWRRLEEVPAAPLAWSYGVARRTIANHRRSGERRRRLFERLRAEPTYDAAAADPDHAEVHASLATLGALDREVVRLWAWEHLEPREIAVVTGMSANAVSIRLHRSRQRLAAVLRKDGSPAGHEGHDGRSRR